MNFSCVLPKLQVGYYAGKEIENVVSCLKDNFMFLFIVVTMLKTFSNLHVASETTLCHFFLNMHRKELLVT